MYVVDYNYPGISFKQKANQQIMKATARKKLNLGQLKQEGPKQ